MIEAALVELLQNDAGVAGLVAERIYPQQLPAVPELPAITYTRISTPRRIRSHSGRSNLVAVRYQLDAWARDSGGTPGYTGSKQLADSIVDALEATANPSSAGHRISAAFVDNDADDLDPDREFDRVILEVTLWANETAIA